MKTVWSTRVVAKNDILDFVAAIKNVFGGRLKTYEHMVNKGIEEATHELREKYPSINNVKIEVTELRNASMCIVVYGEVQNVN